MKQRDKKGRRLPDIKTHFGTVEKTWLPHKAYMRLTCLEMEKYRRMQEKQSAMLRVTNIETRIKEIESEQTVLLETLGKEESVRKSIGICESVAETEVQDIPGFRIKY
jgi:hypothetical protein